MRTLHDVKCDRCGITASANGVDPIDLVESHVCPNGGNRDSIHVTTRIVLGPGERGKDDEPVRGGGR
jgi:hypothetical protein